MNTVHTHKLIIRIAPDQDLTFTAPDQQSAFDLYDIVRDQLPTTPLGYMVVENKTVLN